MALRFLTAFILLMSSLNTYSSTNRTDSLLTVILEENIGETHRMHAKVLLAGELIPGNMDSARVLLEQSRDLAAAVEFPVERSAWLNLAGNYNWYTDNIDSAIVNYSKTYRIQYPEITDRRAAAAVNLASLYNRKGEADSARYYFDNAGELFDLVGDYAGKAHVNFSQGIFYSQRDNYEMALRNLLAALSFQEEEKDTFVLVYIHNALGNVYSSMQNNDKALSHYLTGIGLAENLGDHPTLASLYNNITALYITGLNDYDKAIEYGEKAIQISTEKGHITNLHNLYHNMGILHHNEGRYTESLEWHEKARELEGQIVEAENIAGGHTNMAKTYIRLGQLDQAGELLYGVLNIAGSVEANKWLQLANQELFRLDSIRGDYLAAIGHLQESLRYRDTIWQRERSNRIAELEIIYETDRREAENTMLKEANQLKEQVIANQRRFVFLSLSATVVFVTLMIIVIISRRNIKRNNRELRDLHTRLTEVNNTKDKLFSIISHDLRGPYSALLGLLELLSESFDSMEDGIKRQMISDIQRAGQKTYNLTENLLKWSKLQRGMIVNNAETVDVHDTIEETLTLLRFNLESKNHTVVNKTKPGEFLAWVSPNLLTSILINLFNNAIKFTGKGGQITVYADHEGDMLKICVQDNGMGIPPGNIDTIFEIDSTYRREGTDNEGGTGLGLITVKEFVNLIGGRISVDSREGHGSSFCFTLPEAKNV